jgi:hypothetical protein
MRDPISGLQLFVTWKSCNTDQQMTLKEEVYQVYRDLLEDKISQLELVLQDLHTSAANETKSTAGDKHETALAMLQLEQENKRRQLAELLQQKAVLNRIDPAVANKLISNGALVETDSGYFFISIALGKTIIRGNTIFALSISSPLGQRLAAHSGPGAVTMNSKVYQIISVV